MGDTSLANVYKTIGLKWLRAGFWLLFVGSNFLVVVLSLGEDIGRSYAWACRDCGADLQYVPTRFARPILLTPDPPKETAHRWRFREPWYLKPWLPCNWLKIVIDGAPPNPDALVARRHRGMVE